jgi:hypothetical protein
MHIPSFSSFSSFFISGYPPARDGFGLIRRVGFMADYSDMWHVKNSENTLIPLNLNSALRLSKPSMPCFVLYRQDEEAQNGRRDGSKTQGPGVACSDWFIRSISRPMALGISVTNYYRKARKLKNERNASDQWNGRNVNKPSHIDFTLKIHQRGVQNTVGTQTRSVHSLTCSRDNGVRRNSRWRRIN